MSDDWLKDDPFADPEDPAAREREQRRREREEKRQRKAAKQEAKAEEKASSPPPPPPEEPPLPPRTPEQEFWDEEPEPPAAPEPPEVPAQPRQPEEPNLVVPPPPHPNVASGNGSGRRPRPPVLGAIARHPFLIFAVIAALFFLWFLVSLFQPGHGDGTGQVQVTVPKGSSVSEVGDLLADEDVIANSTLFQVRVTLAGKRSEIYS